MTPEEKELLKRCLELAEENNSMLHSMRRSMRLARVMSIIYWVVIIGTALGALYLVQPYIDTIMSVYGGAKEQLNTVGGVLDNLKQLSQ